MIQEVRVISTDQDSLGQDTLYNARRTLGIQSINRICTVKVYRLEGINDTDVATLATTLFVESINQRHSINAPLIDNAQESIEVGYKPGVMNPEVASILKATRDLGIKLLAADSLVEYHFYGNPAEEEIERIAERLLVNGITQQIITSCPETLIIQGDRGSVTTIPIGLLNGNELMELSNDKLFLNLEEMTIIQAYFQKLGRDPRDAELEVIAARWSEHCDHKTFNAKLVVNGLNKAPLIDRLRQTVEQYGKGVISAFVDNSGVFDFYEGWGICGKVETHNSPAAEEPYGGAATGSGGVFRDIDDTGEGAVVILSTDMFCFARPTLPTAALPPGCLHADYLLRRVVAGVRDYGNRMGIPTANGSVHFHDDFRAKPSVIVGAYGLIPAQKARKGTPQVGDAVIVAGGRTGRDGIHGATFSSGEKTERTIEVNASAVQIGNAIEEKRLFDAMRACRDANLIRARNDCGAAGFPSAVGEMCSENGVHIYLDKVPLKYPGLQPWEILMSESQERDVVAVDPANVEQFLAICRDYNVEATVIGYCTGDKRFRATYYDEVVCDLDMDFLDHGLPQRIMMANWQPPIFDEPDIAMPSNWRELYFRLMDDWNICSKEPIVRQYDHTVQGTNALQPFAGVHYDGPNDAVILTPLHGKPYGLVVAHGMNPMLNRIDSYWGSVWAITEAFANLVAVGGNLDETYCIDNFIWPFPDEDSLGALDLSVDACCDTMDYFKRPFISGKDSLSSTYRYSDGRTLKIPPVLCISLMGKIPDVGRTTSADFKRHNSQIVLLGTLDPAAMAGSVYYANHGSMGNKVPQVNREEFVKIVRLLHQRIVAGDILAAHDISEGGVAVALAEMCFGGDCGAQIDLGNLG